MTDSASSKEPKQRIVRVFVSSTFRDMQEERDELVLKTFPELRKRCRERQVEFVEVDLRWGITEEQSQRGEVLPICLAEIERCRPYFICMLGERYGWVPDEIDPELIQTQEWVKEHKHKSVTELEILHGVLRNPSMAGRSYFYFRDPASLDQVPADQRAYFQSEDSTSRKKLEDLKQRIRESGLHLEENYPDPQALGQLVLNDLWGAVDREFPAEDIPDPLDQEALDHEAFAQNRAKVYVGREEYFKRLDDHVHGDGPPLVLVGESGIGKSALLACWAQRYAKEHPEDFMILHFIGSSSGSTDYRAVIRRIMGEIKRRYQLDLDIPSTPDKLREDFSIWLASAKAKMILILDALNQLEDIDNASHLGWLPNYFPHNIRLIVSSLPGPSMDALEKRNWPQYEVHGLRPDERCALIEEYLGLYRKTLNHTQLELVASAPQTSNPLFLKALLNELRVFGIHEKLDDRIRHYLQAQTVPELYEKILERLEEDYERDYEDLVGDSLSFIWASRRGLYESEVLELLGDADQPVSRMIWSPLYLAMEDSLVNRSGLLNFFHDYLRQAVEKRYIPTAKAGRNWHGWLADYFHQRNTDDRKADELPWQLQKAEDWDALKDCLTNMSMFLTLFTEAKPLELTGYWIELTKNGFDMVESYLLSLKNFENWGATPETLRFVLERLANLFVINTRNDAAAVLSGRALQIQERILGPDNPGIAGSLASVAFIQHRNGNYAEAESLYRRALQLQEQANGPTHVNTANALSSLGGLLCDKADYDEAERLIKRALEIYEQALGPMHPITAIALYTLAMVLIKKGAIDEAEPFCRRALRIQEQVLGSTHPAFALTANCLAMLLFEKGDYEEAGSLCKTALKIQEQALGLTHPSTVEPLANLSLVIREKGHYDEAERLLRRALEICERGLGALHPKTAEVLNLLAGLLRDKNDDAAAESLYRRAVEIREQVLGPEHPDTAISLGNLASLLLDKGHSGPAVVLFKRASEILVKTLGEAHPLTVTILDKLVSLTNAK